ncbi:MAG TPA: lipoprotein insertase outer membrane protein LolB [Halioglobus sp.]
MPSARQLPVYLLLSLLAACAGLDQREPTSAGWKVHSQRLASLQQWTANGKLAVRTTDASDSASMVWQQQDKDTYLQLSGPLGVGATTIYSDGRQLDIRQGDDHRTLDISTPDAIALNTGWDLPLHALTYWLKGLPSPDYKVQRLELDPHTELLRNLQQDDWEVRYDRYGQFQGFTLPTRLHIQRGATQAKVVILEWRTPSS